MVKGDLSKRWYVYFAFRNLKTGKLDRMENVYGKVKHYKTKEYKVRILSSYRKNLFLLLKQGFNPLADNSELYQQLKTLVIEKEICETPKEEVISTKTINEAIKIAVKEALDENTITSLIQNVLVKGKLTKITKSAIENTQKTTPIKEQNTENKNQEGMSIVKAFDFALSLKEKAVSIGTIKDYKRKIKLFIAWMEETHATKKNIREISRKNLFDYFNGIVLKTSARNRNNYRTELRSIIDQNNFRPVILPI
jgi:hypothetical protein